jgi:hypothetical protein
MLIRLQSANDNKVFKGLALWVVDLNTTQKSWAN